LLTCLTDLVACLATIGTPVSCYTLFTIITYAISLGVIPYICGSAALPASTSQADLEAQKVETPEQIRSFISKIAIATVDYLNSVGITTINSLRVGGLCVTASFADCVLGLNMSNITQGFVALQAFQNRNSTSPN
jgi:hypothetical protein